MWQIWIAVRLGVDGEDANDRYVIASGLSAAYTKLV